MSDANQKRCKFAPDTMIAPKLYRCHGRWCWFTLMFLITRLCTTIARVEHELLYALSSTIIDYHQLSWKLKLPSTIINYYDRFNRAQRFAEGLRMRRYSNITVPIALQLSNFCSINNNTVGDGWLLVMTLRTLVLVLWMSPRLKLDIKDS